MKPWTRADTKEWIYRLENRVEDIDFYLKRTLEWCEDNAVYSDRIVLICCIMAITWVCHLRNESISKKELFEILGIDDVNQIDDEVFTFNKKYEDMELEELLQFVVDSF